MTPAWGRTEAGDADAVILTAPASLGPGVYRLWLTATDATNETTYWPAVVEVPVN